jgi:hypothetical protein
MIPSDTFRLNGYRVLRVPASASAFDIHKAAIRRAGAPGLPRTSEIDIPALGEVPRADADICAAVARLANPIHRITHRLFWFCQLPAAADTQRAYFSMDPTDHDAVLHTVINSTRLGVDEFGLAARAKALRAWHTVTRDDDYWFLMLIYEDQGGFETTATLEEMDALRADAVRIAAEPLILSAHGALAAGDRDTVRRIRTALYSLRDTGPWALAAINELPVAENDRHEEACPR